MSYEIYKEILENNLNNEILIFLKNNFRHQGVLLGFDESSLKLDDMKVGVIAISLDEISTMRGNEDGR